MVKTIRVSEPFHEWVRAHKREEETMEDALRRLTRMPSPEEFRGILSAEDVDEVEAAIETLRERDRDRLAETRQTLEDQ
ncbi:MAG: antitoxin VapB family protein [Halobacteriaceae archaeon]